MRKAARNAPLSFTNGHGVLRAASHTLPRIDKQTSRGFDVCDVDGIRQSRQNRRNLNGRLGVCGHAAGDETGEERPELKAVILRAGCKLDLAGFVRIRSRAR